MVNTIDITNLMRETGINHHGVITVTEKMSGLEPNPRDDWLYYGLNSLNLTAQERGTTIRSAAFIGSGNGIETIAALKLFPNLKNLYVTDIVPEILPQIQKNIESNFPKGLKRKRVNYSAGRDCIPLEQKVDLIYGNLPLVVVNTNRLNRSLSTTTLTDAAAYRHLSRGENDLLRKYSLLSQLGFLISAKERLNDSGIIITLIGGRIPYEAIEECFARAGLEQRLLLTGFKKQSDPQFLKEYSDFEAKEKTNFVFYDYAKAAGILESVGVKMPDIIAGYSDKQLKKILRPAQINASQAYELSKQGKDIGHLAYAFAANL
ncbi:MAG TPA: hypothetical protein VJI97_01700 [Candidatus Nanoarchaeia archaeon]|nr:hypothetical protein [Candidatus Nanoarchaeia archaeon]